MTKQTSRQNITRDVEIEKKLTVTRGKVERANGRERRKGCQGTSIKDTWTKPKGGRIEGERWECHGWGIVRGNGDNCT